jgi:predicted amidophosphoribosyltransferase
MKTTAEYARDRRKRLVDSGRCGSCMAKRNKYDWLCDECAEKHRERQRRATEKGKESGKC